MEGIPGLAGGFAVVDVETTGFAPDRERLVEVGVVLLDVAGEEEGSFGTLLDPGCDPGPTHVHGVTAAMVEGAPTFTGIHPYLAGLLSGRVVVGHNVEGFDLPFLVAECRRTGGEALVPAAPPLLDTLRVAQRLLGMAGRARLIDCCSRYELSWADHHAALGDARATAALFNRMRAEVGDEALGLVSLMAAARRSQWPGASPVVPPVRVRADLGVA